MKDKEDENVAFCFIRDGSITAKLKIQDILLSFCAYNIQSYTYKTGQFVTISDADDLLKIGMKQVDYTAFYDELKNYAA